VNTIDFFPGGSMGKMKGRGMPNILQFISYREGWQKSFKFYLNKVLNHSHVLIIAIF